jgi:hypothetical protein
MDKKEQKNLRVFGYGLSLIIAFFVVRLGLQHGFSIGKITALILAGFLVLLTAWQLQAIKPFYRVWMKAARFIGEVVNFVLLSVIFYLFFGTIGIILRILRKDLLDEKIDKSALTYWKTVRLGSFDRENYRKQF